MLELRSTVDSGFLEAVLAGLRSTPKTLPCRYFYDHAGSVLFDRICDLPEYYLTRAEDEILAARSDEIAASVPPGAEVVELGSGTARKTRRLITAFLLRQGTLRYVPVDISASMLAETAAQLTREFECLRVTPVAAEYYEAMYQLGAAPGPPKLVLFLGSNLGNFDAEEARRFLRQMRSMLGPQDRALIGLDLRKERSVLEAAYDDAQGITARFNLNLLARINRELGADFDVEAFRHRARYDAELGRVEMHLVSRRPQSMRIDGTTIEFEAGESIHTENSYKYSIPQVRELATRCELHLLNTWLDTAGRFSLNLLRPI